jgi:hypothetical protein
MAAVAVAAIGCDRKPRLLPAGSDSTGVVDSAMVRLRNVQQMWESGGASEQAAAHTAAALWESIEGLPPAEWKDRADLMLDSLGIGSESAASDCALLVNFFTRSDPSGGSWPYLFACGRKPQAVEGRNLRLWSLVTRGLGGDPAASASAGAAALFGRRAGPGQQPVLMVWVSKKDGSWDLSQTLGPDSLGGIGTADFETVADTTVELMTRAYRTPPFFDECATCPHLYKMHRFRWGPRDFTQSAPDSLVPSPYATFVQFIQALVSNDRTRAYRLAGNDGLVDQAVDREWGKPRGSWRVAPAATETPQQIVFFRGDREAYRVHFSKWGEDWVITSFEETARNIE